MTASIQPGSARDESKCTSELPRYADRRAIAPPEPPARAQGGSTEEEARAPPTTWRRLLLLSDP